MDTDPVFQPETKPGIASAEAGFVVLDGPAGIAVTMTADAAELTAQSLHAAAIIAGQHDFPGSKHGHA